MERICANCGVKSNEDTAFCTKCGTPYPTPEEQQLKNIKSLTPKVVIASEPVIKRCPHCKAEIPVSAKKCSHCGSDLRAWPLRHPILSIFLIIILLILIGDASKPTQQVNVPSNSAQDASATTVQESVPLNNNNPS